MYGGVDVQIQGFLTSEVVDEWSVSGSGRFIPEERTACIQRLGRCASQSRSGPREDKKILPLTGLELQPVGRASRSQSLYQVQVSGGANQSCCRCNVRCVSLCHAYRPVGINKACYGHSGESTRRTFSTGKSIARHKYKEEMGCVQECTNSHVVRLEALVVTMNNAVFWDIKSQFVPHRRNITSPLQSPSDYCYVRFEVVTAVTMKNAVFWDKRTLFLPHRRHITSLLQITAG
jgi:hypothetical protein